eukprot:6456938-Amphidinium_carterae.1
MTTYLVIKNIPTGLREQLQYGILCKCTHPQHDPFWENERPWAWDQEHWHSLHCSCVGSSVLRAVFQFRCDLISSMKSTNIAISQEKACALLPCCDHTCTRVRFETLLVQEVDNCFNPAVDVTFRASPKRAAIQHITVKSCRTPQQMIGCPSHKDQSGGSLADSLSTF